MTITERTLRTWRADALIKLKGLDGWDSKSENTTTIRQQAERITRMTQELLDQHLLRRENKK